MKEDKRKIIIDFLEEYLTQDARSTRKPLFFIIRDARWVWSDEGSGDECYKGLPTERNIYVNKEDYEEEHETLEDLHRYLSEQEDEEIGDISDYIDDNYDEMRLILIWQQSRMFLTHTDAENHLKRNRYKYSEYAHTYVEDVFRAPQLEEFLDSLISYFGVNDPDGKVCKSCDWGKGGCKLNHCCYKLKDTTNEK